jgi:PDZ domain-containing protein
MVVPTSVAVAQALPATALVTKERCTLVDTDRNCIEQVTEPVQYALVPGSADAVNPRLRIDGVTQFPSNGDAFFVTVTNQPDDQPLRLFEWFVGRGEGAVVLQSRFDRYGDETPQQQRQRGRVAMDTSKRDAIYVAFTRVGIEATLQPGVVRIEEMVCFENPDGGECDEFAPSDEVLDPGDVLLELDGEPIEIIDDLTKALADNAPGDTVAVRFERNGEESDGEIELVASPDDATRTIVGFVPADTSTVDLDGDVEVLIDTDQVGGPSAGTAFTVTLIDELTEGDLLGGNDVAFTGTINVNGEIGAIGGLTSKASAVQQAGVRYLFVPVAQGERDIAAARRVVGDDVEIIPVGTIDEVLAALVELGGDPLPAPGG